MINISFFISSVNPEQPKLPDQIAAVLHQPPPQPVDRQKPQKIPVPGKKRKVLPNRLPTRKKPLSHVIPPCFLSIPLIQSVQPSSYFLTLSPVSYTHLAHSHVHPPLSFSFQQLQICKTPHPSGIGCLLYTSSCPHRKY